MKLPYCFGSVVTIGLCLLSMGLSAQLEYGGVIASSQCGYSDILTFDFDEDGDLDFLAHCGVQFELYWIENMGEGEFSGRQTLHCSGDQLNELHITDMDNDGDEDIVGVAGAVNADGYVFIIENNGNGDFQDLRQICHVLNSPIRISSGYLNGNGYADLAITTIVDDHVKLIYDAGIEQEPEIQSLPDIEEFNVLVFGTIMDCDEDGLDDVLVVGRQTFEVDDVLYHKNLGNGEFVSTPLFTHNTNEVVIGDLDGDDDLDFISHYGSFFMFYVNQNDGNYNAWQIPHGWESDLVSLTLFDANDDGLPEVVAKLSEGAVIFENLGGFSFAEPEVLFDIPSSDPHSLTVGDIDENGFDDLVIGFHEARLQLWFSAGDGNLEVEEHYNNLPTHDMAIADLENDGDIDVVVSQINDGRMFTATQISDGVFADPVEFTNWFSEIDFHMADLDNDLDDDIIGATEWDDGVRLMENLGNGSFSDPVFVASNGGDFDYFDSGDINGDGNMDIVAVRQQDDDVVWLENLGDWQFAPYEQLLEIDIWLESLEVVKLNSDSASDLVLATDDYIFVAINDSGFSQLDTVAPIQDIISYCSGDLDQDGDIDFCTQYLDSLYWIENTQEGWVTHFVDEIPSAWFTFTFGDIDNDSQVDILRGRATTTGGPVRAYLNNGENDFTEIIYSEKNYHNIRQMIVEDADNDGENELLLLTLNEVVWLDTRFGEGCMDPDACNYVSGAWIDDGSCYYSPCYNLLDGDGDGVIGLADLLVLLGGFGCVVTEENECFGDANEDGIVNILDLLVFLEWMGTIYCDP